MLCLNNLFVLIPSSAFVTPAVSNDFKEYDAILKKFRRPNQMLNHFKGQICALWHVNEGSILPSLRGVMAEVWVLICLYYYFFQIKKKKFQLSDEYIQLLQEGSGRCWYCRDERKHRSTEGSWKGVGTDNETFVKSWGQFQVYVGFAAL